MNKQHERVLGRSLARELSQDEINLVSGAGTSTACTCRVGGGEDYCSDAPSNVEQIQG